MTDVIDQLRSSLGHRFAVEREIGRGGMGIVFRARDLEHDRDVAIKVLRPEFRASVASARWVREIEIVHELDHPHILPMYDSGEADGLLYSVMPFVDGETLRQRLQREDQLPLDDALRIAYQIADAMAYAHGRGIVHRDIKPANVLLADGKALVSDFGIARAITVAGGDELTESGVAVGTPSYMSPEQAGGGSKLDGRSDVYSLGCVLYEMLVGEPPFTGHSAQVIIARQLQERHPSIRVPRPSVPDAVEYAVDRALEKTPADRFATSDEFRDALNVFVTGDFTADVRLRRRKPKRWRVLITAAAAMVAIAGWFLWPRTPPVLNARHVVVFPTVVSADSVDGRWITEGLPIIVTSALDGAGLRGFLGWKWLDSRQRADPAALSHRAQRALARKLGAMYFVTGVAVTMRDSIQLRLALTDSETGAIVDEVTEAGGTAALATVAFRAASRLIATLGSADRLFAPSPLEDRHPEAIAAFFQGEVVYHRGRFEDAVNHYDRALAADSSLWMAALRGAHAAFWSTEHWNRSEEFIALALPDTGRMSNAQLFLVKGMDAAFRGRADLALGYLDRALEADALLTEAWMARGEVLQTLLPQVPRRDSLALEAFRRVFELDPDFAPALYQMQVLSLRAGEIREAEVLYRRYARARPDSTLFAPIRVMLQCVIDGPASVDWRAEVQDLPRHMVTVPRSLSVGGRHLDCARHAAEALLKYDNTERRNWATSAVHVLQNIYVGEGRFGEAKALVDSLADNFGQVWRVFSVIYALDAEPFREDAQRFVDSVGTDYGRIDFQELWALALWASHRSDINALVGIRAAAVERTASIPDTDGTEPSLKTLVRVIDARLPLAMGDTTATIDALRDLRPRAAALSIRQSAFGALAAEHMLLARLLMARAEGADTAAAAALYHEALDVALHIANGAPTTFLPLLRPSLEIVHRAAQEIGDVNRAAEARRRLEALDASPDVRAP